MSVYNSYKSFPDILRVTEKWPGVTKLTEQYRNHLLGVQYEPFKAILSEYEQLLFKQRAGTIGIEEIQIFLDANSWLIKPEDTDEFWRPEPPGIVEILDSDVDAFKLTNWLALRKAAYNNPTFKALESEAMGDYLINNDSTKMDLYNAYLIEIKTFFPKPA